MGQALGSLVRGIKDLELVVEEEFECARCTVEELCQKDRVEGFTLLIGLTFWDIKSITK